MGFKKKLNELSKAFNYKTHFPNYVFNKKIVWGYIILLCLIVGGGYFLYGGVREVYVECKTEKCFNPLYDPYCVGEDCYSELMVQGETIGTPPPFVFKYFKLIALLLGVLAVALNHFLFNRNETLTLRLHR